MHSVLASAWRSPLQVVFCPHHSRETVLCREINDIPQVRFSARSEPALPNKVTSRDGLQFFKILRPLDFHSIALLGLSLPAAPSQTSLLAPLSSLLCLTSFLCSFPYKPGLGNLSTQKNPKPIFPLLNYKLPSPSFLRSFMDTLSKCQKLNSLFCPTSSPSRLSCLGFHPVLSMPRLKSYLYLPHLFHCPHPVPRLQQQPLKTNKINYFTLYHYPTSSIYFIFNLYTL